MSSLKQKVIEHLKQLEIKPKRSLGQNFLINPMVVEKILQQVARHSFDSVIEIGPGLGALTDHLIEKYQEKLLLIEMDRKFSEIWRQRGVNIIEADALKVNWNDFENLGQVCLVSNLPYQIAASLVIERSFVPININVMVLMFQKEVAERIYAQPGGKDYGILSIIAQNYWKIKKVCNAGRNDFYPPPNILSQVLSFERLAECCVDEGENFKFLSFVKRSFQQRRKYLLKNIATDINSDLLRTQVVEQLQAWDFNEKVRAEQLSPNNFVELFKMVNK